jgi:hypothetical protein
MATTRYLAILASVIQLHVVCGLRGIGQDYFPTIENGKRKDSQQFLLGPVGGILEIEFGSRQATNVALAPDGPGSLARLQPGEILVGVGQKSFSGVKSAKRA